MLDRTRRIDSHSYRGCQDVIAKTHSDESTCFMYEYVDETRAVPDILV